MFTAPVKFWATAHSGAILGIPLVTACCHALVGLSELDTETAPPPQGDEGLLLSKVVMVQEVVLVVLEVALQLLQ